ncbi:MAG: diphosphomevalonate/mevalonate 3,5-bisphosphate decarboxylase family protein [Bacteroidota bacterium]
MMTEKDFVFQQPKTFPKSGMCSAKAPSNIALVKYWGKKEIQIPKNTSLSFTLANCYTQTELHFEEKKTNQQDIQVSVFLDQQPAPDFEPKIIQFFERIEEYFPLIRTYHFTIKTKNTFPHSSGIASSASGMSALAMCLVQLEQQIQPTKVNEDYLRKKASFLARLGSGSACRSIDGGLVLWGKHTDIQDSSDLYGIEFNQNVQSVFRDFCDTILIVDKGQKKVSSSLGHSLMNGHPYAESRFLQAQDNIKKLQEILTLGDLKQFIRLVESEALTLHAMMMTSRPYFLLMSAQTLEILNKIWAYRDETKIPLCFTLDAGANVHLLYPNQYQKEVRSFIDERLKQHCENGQFIHDQVGNGASFGASQFN